ncbi:MAG TPA: FtsX-like permease family protein [Thermoanaerobaculia bacterium]|nr:FtsX-like permease family protein [Thermoanaerobaculia bacterium]
MIVRLALLSLRRRFRQLALILAAVMVAAATVSTLAGFSSRAEGRLGESLAAFGPNLTVRPQVGAAASLPSAVATRVRQVPGVHSVAPASDARHLDVRADPGRLLEVARAIEARVEGIEARPLLRVSESDARVTRRLLLVLAAVSAVSFLLALLSVGAATTALVGERRVEIGLLLALGYTGRRVGAFLAAELLAAALLAGAVGEVAGEIAAGGLARRMLGGAGGLSLTWGGFGAAALVAVLVVGSSMLVALRRVERLDAARVLRGE